MSIDILGLTSTAEVRAVLAISVAEASDQLLIDFSLENELKLDLLDWRDDYKTIISDGADGTPTATQQRNLLLLKKFAKYFCVHKIIVAGEVFVAQMVSDGNSQFKRYAADWELIRGRIAAEASAAKADLIEAVDSTTPSTHTIMGKSTPEYDPVAHE